MRDIEKISSYITSGKSFRIMLEGIKATDWLTEKSSPDFIDLIHDYVNDFDSVTVEIGRIDGNKTVCIKKFEFEKQNEEENIIDKAPRAFANATPPPSPHYTPMVPVSTNLSGYSQPQVQPQQNPLNTYYETRITDLMDQVRELKEDLKEAKTEKKQLAKRNQELELSLSVKDQKSLLEIERMKYSQENSLSGIIKELVKPETAESLSTYATAIKGDKAVDQNKLGSIDLGSDLKNAVVEKISKMDDKTEVSILYNTINSERWQEAVKAEKEAQSKNQA